MFIYWAQEGRYWLRGVLLMPLLALTIGLLSPVAALAQDNPFKAPAGSVVRAAGVGGNSAAAPNAVPGAPQNNGNSRGGASTASNSGDQGNNNYRAPSGAPMLAGTALSRKTFKPWIPTSMPWDGKWGAFNSSVSETLGGNCVLSVADQAKWTAFMRGSQNGYQKAATDNKGKAGPTTAAWRKQLTVLIGGNTVAKKLLGGANSSTVQSLTNHTDLVSLAASSPQLASCNRNNDVLKTWADGFVPNPLALFKQPGRFIAQLLCFLPASVGFLLFKTLSNSAFGMALTTPHSERGDTVFNTFSATASNGAAAVSRATTLTPSGGNGKVSSNMGAIAGKSNCTGSGSAADTQLGFSCANTKAGNQSAPWVKAASAMRSALSAVYGIIVIAVALMYLFRRNAQSQYNLKVLLPRLFLAVMLTMAAPYLIGMVITFSNWIVQGLFASLPGSVPQQLMQAVVSLTEANSLETGLGLVGVYFSMLIPTILLLLIDAVMLYLLAVALGKQIILIFLILLTPIACLSFVFREHGKHLFALWTKGILAVAAVPVAMAAVLVTGLMLASVFFHPADSASMLNTSSVAFSSQSGMFPLVAKYISAIIVAATLIMMVKTVGSLRAWVTGSKVGMGGKMMGSAAKVGGLAAGAAAAYAGAPQLAGAAVNMGNKAGNRLSQGSQSNRSGWVPKSSSTLGSASATRGGAAPVAGLLDRANSGVKSLNQDQRRQQQFQKALDAKIPGGSAGGASAAAASNAPTSSTPPVTRAASATPDSATSGLGTNYQTSASGLHVPPSVTSDAAESAPGPGGSSGHSAPASSSLDGWIPSKGKMKENFERHRASARGAASSVSEVASNHPKLAKTAKGVGIAAAVVATGPVVPAVYAGKKIHSAFKARKGASGAGGKNYKDSAANVNDFAHTKN
jgi:hypothetical protein